MSCVCGQVNGKAKYKTSERTGRGDLVIADLALEANVAPRLDNH